MIRKTVAFLMLFGTAVGLTSFNKSLAPQKPMLRTIVIDPGHGGFDPGTHGLLAKEKDVALAISLRLGKALQLAFPGIKVVYTRTTDIMPGNRSTLQDGIRYRAELANRSNGDLFICIHCNSNGRAAGKYPVKRLLRYRIVGKGRNKQTVPVYATTWVKNTTRGTTTYIWKADRNIKKGSAVDDMLRNGENMGDSTGTAFDMSTPEAMMRAQLYEKKYFANSALFGTLVQQEFVKTGRVSYGVQQRPVGIGVLEATGMPSVLIETGYLTNREEEKYLVSNQGQGEVARNIVNALKNYQKKILSE
ncbi:MAG TPA: N-acetylmuramoyl-L-alanine amidase [Puia sp.]|jgi:N-acetylmuramoyl-L-alanine amidase|nr:N-acetylmuramoyl-L-alanine amidase [Puia sp.]